MFDIKLERPFNQHHDINILIKTYRKKHFTRKLNKFRQLDFWEDEYRYELLVRLVNAE